MKNILYVPLAIGFVLMTFSWAAAQERYDRNSSGGRGEVFYIEAEVLDYRPAYGYSRARQGSRCYSDRRSHNRHRKNGTGGAILGALIGGVAGSQIGDGSGRKIAIVGGAVAGGVIGHKVATRDNDDSYSCRQRNGGYEEQTLVGYDVYYLFHGRQHALRTRYEPNRYLRLRVAVVAEE